VPAAGPVLGWAETAATKTAVTRKELVRATQTGDFFTFSTPCC
jgi:hypothetical protein